ncbi:MAG: DUF952 domain-containing protein [Tepidiformaceae bacterium]
MAEIYHMLPAAEWAAFRASGASEYRAASLAAEGFMHCTVGERNLIGVATRYYAADPTSGWTVLVIDPARVSSEVRWQPQPDGLAYPHIHGPLNGDAILEARPFPRTAGGAFLPFYP